MTTAGSFEQQLAVMRNEIARASVHNVQDLCDLLSRLKFQRGYLAPSVAPDRESDLSTQVRHFEARVSELRGLQAHVARENERISSLRPPLFLGKHAFFQELDVRKKQLAESEQRTKLLVGEVSVQNDLYQTALRELKEIRGAREAVEQRYLSDEETFSTALREAIQPLATIACLTPVEIANADSILHHRSYYRHFFVVSHKHRLFERIGWQHLTWNAFWVIADGPGWRELTEVISDDGRELQLKDLIGDILWQYVGHPEECGQDPKFWWVRIRMATIKMNMSESIRFLCLMEDWYNQFRSEPATLEKVTREGIVGNMLKDPDFCKLFRMFWESIISGKTVATNFDDDKTLNLITREEQSMESRYHVGMIYRILCERG